MRRHGNPHVLAKNCGNSPEAFGQMQRADTNKPSDALPFYQTAPHNFPHYCGSSTRAFCIIQNHRARKVVLMRRTSMSRFVPFLVMLTMATSGTAGDTALLEQNLGGHYKLSSVNAEGEFVVKGTTLVLRKSGFTGGADPITCIHQYKDVEISLTGPSKAACTGAVRALSKIPFINKIPGVSTANQAVQGNAPTTRPFVAGEKLYMAQDRGGQG